jgi:hypothetical protein
MRRFFQVFPSFLIITLGFIGFNIVTSCGKKKEEPSAISVTLDGRDLNTDAAGKLLFGEKRAVLLTLSNLGEMDAAITSLTFADANGNDIPAYSYYGGTFPGTEGSCTSGLGGGATCTISIAFADPTTEPYLASTYEGVATLKFSDSEGSYEKKFAVGITTPAFVTIKHDTKKLTAYDFGNRDFAASRSVTLSLENTGEMAATISGMTFANAQGAAVSAFGYKGGSFPGTGGSCTSTLSPDTACSIVISFTAPTATVYASTAYSATATLAFYNGVASKAATFTTAGDSVRCAAGSDTTIEQFVIDAGSAHTISQTNNSVGQSFSFPEKRLIKKITLSQYRDVGTTVGSVRLSFYSDSSGSPAATPTATQDFADPGISSGSRAFHTYTFTTPVEIPASTTYYFGVTYPTISGGNVYTDKYLANAESTGQLISHNGTSWSTSSTVDLVFAIDTCLADTAEEASATYAD